METLVPHHRPAFVTRCESLGLPVWTLDESCAIAAQPELHTRHLTPEVLRWLASPAIIQLVIQTAASKAPDEPGLRFLRAEDRSSPGRSFVALVLSREFLGSERLASAVTDLGMDPGSFGDALAPLASRTADAAEAVLECLSLTAADLAELDESKTVIDGFTTQLTDSFDTIDFLYTVGRGMRNPEHPERFVELVVERIFTSLNFEWVTAQLGEKSKAVLSLPTIQRHFHAGVFPEGTKNPREITRGIVDRLPREAASHVLDRVEGLSSGKVGQVLVQPIVKDGIPFAAILAGGKRGSDPCVSSWDIQLIESAAGFLGSFLETVSLYETQKRTFMGTLRAITSAIDAKDHYTRGHSERVAHLAEQIAKGLGMSEERCERVRVAGLVHDVGKIGVPEAVLTKAGRLTDAEFDAIKRHPQIGYDILRDIPQLEDVLAGVLYHHEQWGGSGYPCGLSGESIPMIARILTVADTFDAMSSTRSYRPAMPRERVLEEFRRCAGTQFDPTLVPVMLALDLSGYDGLVARHAAGAPAQSNLAA